MISIVIPTKNEEEYLPRLLCSINMQDYQVKVIVSDCNSSDDTVSIAYSYMANVVEDSINQAQALNRGAEVCKNKYILFLDADTSLPQFNFLSELSEYIDEKDIEIASGRLKDIYPNVSSKAWKVYRENISTLTSGFMLIERELFSRINGFDEGMTSGFDRELAYRIKKRGYKIDYMPFFVYHNRPLSQRYNQGEYK
jgi:glycosyltransferase involved in cell wall biosynthesis